MLSRADMADCKIIILGAGLGGLGMAAQLKRLLNEDDFELYEKLDDVGGTWAQNHYPNLSCDVPSEVESTRKTIAQAAVPG